MGQVADEIANGSDIAADGVARQHLRLRDEQRLPAIE